MVLKRDLSCRRRVALSAAFGVACAAALVAASLPASAAYVSRQVSNKYLHLVVGVSGDADAAGPNRSAGVEVAGRFTVGTVTGDPTTPDDDYTAILAGFPDPWGAYTVVTIDGSTAIRYGDTENGEWEQTPVANEAADVITDAFTFTLEDAPAVTVYREFRLLRDVVRVEYRLQNVGVQSHSVAVATSLDTEFGLEQDQVAAGGPFYMPVEGAVGGAGVWSGSSVPSVVYGFNNLPNYTIGSQVILRGGDATAPDRIVAVNAASSFDVFPYDFEPVTGADLLSDSALLMFWRARTPPRSTAGNSIVFYFGISSSTADYSEPLVLATSAPFSLNYVAGEGDQAGDIEPDPFNIIAYAYNLNNNVALDDTSLQITLPPGLVLDDGEQIIKRINYIAPGGEGEVGWRVRADGTEFGPLDYTVSVSGELVTGKAVTRTIVVPATERRYLLNEDPYNPFSRREMMSVPFQALDSNISTTFGLLPGDFTALKFNPAKAVYEPVTSIVPGQGFWFDPMILEDHITLNNVQPVSTSASGPFLIKLNRGWNQIGTPYLYPSAWGSFRVVKNLASGDVSVQEAAQRNWIRSAVHWWDYYIYDYRSSSLPGTMIQPWVGYWVRALEPVWLSVPPVAPIGQMVAGDGSTNPGTEPGDDDDDDGGGGGPGNPPTPWSVSSASAPEEQAAAVVAPLTMAKTGHSGNQIAVVTKTSSAPSWRVRLAVEGAAAHDTQNYFGSDPASETGFDVLDIDEAPPAGNLSLCFLNRGWGADSGRYSTDLRPVLRTALWNVEVLNRGKAERLSIYWDGLDTLPAGTSLVMKDLKTRKSVHLRPGQSYEFDCAAGETRLLQITSQGRLRRGR